MPPAVGACSVSSQESEGSIDLSAGELGQAPGGANAGRPGADDQDMPVLMRSQPRPPFRSFFMDRRVDTAQASLTQV